MSRTKYCVASKSKGSGNLSIPDVSSSLQTFNSTTVLLITSRSSRIYSSEKTELTYKSTKSHTMLKSLVEMLNSLERDRNE